MQHKEFLYHNELLKVNHHKAQEIVLPAPAEACHIAISITTPSFLCKGNSSSDYQSNDFFACLHFFRDLFIYYLRGNPKVLGGGRAWAGRGEEERISHRLYWLFLIQVYVYTQGTEFWKVSSISTAIIEMCCLLENNKRILKQSCRICHVFCHRCSSKSTGFLFHNMWEEIPMFASWGLSLQVEFRDLLQYVSLGPAFGAHPRGIFTCVISTSTTTRCEAQQGSITCCCVQSVQGFPNCQPIIFLRVRAKLRHKVGLAETFPFFSVFIEIVDKEHKAEKLPH